MVRLISFFVLLAAATAGLAWLADRPGTLTIDWLGYQSRLSVFQAVVLLLVFMAVVGLAYSLVRSVFASPAAMSRYVNRRKQQQGLEALTSGMIAVGAGNHQLATRYANLASRALPNEPLTDLLRAQTAHLAGDRKTAQRVYEQMLISPQTELLGLRGLFLDAEHGNDLVAARSLAEQALKRGPKLAWASQALFDIQCRQADWPGAIDTLTAARRNDLVPRKLADRRRAVLLAAQAAALEETDGAKAEALALEAHDLAPGLVPAAEVAGRLLAARGRMQKAAAVIEQTWRRGPHPDLALVYAHARPGDSLRDRLQRVRKLAAMTPGNREGAIAIANAAIEARAWNEARTALEPLLADGLSARVCVLKARAEGGEKGDQGRVREWLARAIHAPRDPVWVADGHVSDRWAAVSPITGRLDAYEWKVAEERTEKVSGALLLEELAQYATSNREGLVVAPTANRDAETIETDPPDTSNEAPAAVDIAPATAKRGLRAVESSKSASVQDPGLKDARAAPVNLDSQAGATDANRPVAAPAQFKRPMVVADGDGRVPQPADIAFYVAPRAPDDPGTEAAEASRKAAS